MNSIGFSDQIKDALEPFKRALPFGEDRRLAYLDAKARSDEEHTRVKHAGYERKTDGRTTILSRLRRYVAQRAGSDSLILSGSGSLAFNLVADAMMTSTWNAMEAIRNFKLPELSTAPSSKPNSLLSKDFRGIDVNKEVYETLHSHESVVTFQREIDDIQKKIANAVNPDFKGQLTGEFKALQEGACVMPLGCEFRAHAALKEEGIEYNPIDKVFIFPEHLVQNAISASPAKAGDTALRIHMFNNHAAAAKATMEPEGQSWGDVLNERLTRMIDDLTRPALTPSLTHPRLTHPAPAY